MNRKDLVKKTIKFQDPNRIPLFIFNGDRNDSDIMQIDLERFYLGSKKNITEWGFEWDNPDPLLMGTPIKPPISKWDDFEYYKNYKKPNPFDKTRFNEVSEVIAKYGKDRYYMGSLYLTGFTIMSFLRGYCNLLEDIYINREKVEELAEMVFGIENDIIRQMKDYKFDGVSLWDDWGTQTNMIIKPDIWREIFKPKYREQFKLAHSYNLDVYFHTCGMVYDIIPDLIEIGVDMLNLGQPDINGIERIGRDFGGKICF